MAHVSTMSAVAEIAVIVVLVTDFLHTAIENDFASDLCLACECRNLRVPAAVAIANYSTVTLVALVTMEVELMTRLFKAAIKEDFTLEMGLPRNRFWHLLPAGVKIAHFQAVSVVAIVTFVCTLMAGVFIAALKYDFSFNMGFSFEHVYFGFPAVYVIADVVAMPIEALIAMEFAFVTGLLEATIEDDFALDFGLTTERLQFGFPASCAVANVLAVAFMALEAVEVVLVAGVLIATIKVDDTLEMGLSFECVHFGFPAVHVIADVVAMPIEALIAMEFAFVTGLLEATIEDDFALDSGLTTERLQLGFPAGCPVANVLAVAFMALEAVEVVLVAGLLIATIKVDDTLEMGLSFECVHFGFPAVHIIADVVTMSVETLIAMEFAFVTGLLEATIEDDFALDSGFTTERLQFGFPAGCAIANVLAVTFMTLEAEEVVLVAGLLIATIKVDDTLEMGLSFECVYFGFPAVHVIADVVAMPIEALIAMEFAFVTGLLEATIEDDFALDSGFTTERLQFGFPAGCAIANVLAVTFMTLEAEEVILVAGLLVAAIKEDIAMDFYLANKHFGVLLPACLRVANPDTVTIVAVISTIVVISACFLVATLKEDGAFEFQVGLSILMVMQSVPGVPQGGDCKGC
ncbi:hypothetical protein SprV_0501844100 [Sparganum proliferum]